MLAFATSPQIEIDDIQPSVKANKSIGPALCLQRR